MTPSELPERMRTWRRDHDLSQRDAAARAGIHYSFWSKIESGAAEPSLMRRLAIEAAIAEPATVYDPRGDSQEPVHARGSDLTYRMDSATAAALTGILGPCTEGDELIFDRARKPFVDAIAMFSANARTTIGIYRTHPFSGAGILYPVDSDHPIPESAITLIGVATALIRPLRTGPVPA